MKRFMQKPNKRPFRIHLVFIPIFIVVLGGCAASDLDVEIHYLDEADARMSVRCQDSINVAFEGGFQGDTVQVTSGGQVMFGQRLKTELSLGLAKIIRIRKSKDMELLLEINGLRAEEIEWPEDYCQMRVKYHGGDRKLEVTFTNQLLVYF